VRSWLRLASSSAGSVGLDTSRIPPADSSTDAVASTWASRKWLLDRLP
jgi:hypothetical protein